MRLLSSSRVVRDGAGTRISFHTNTKYSGKGRQSLLPRFKKVLSLFGCIAPEIFLESCRIFHCTARSWFPNQGLNQQPLNCKEDIYALDHQPSPSVHLQLHIFTCSWHIIIVLHLFLLSWGLEFPRWLSGPPADTGDAGDMGSTPGSGRSPGGGNGNPLQCSCLENPMDTGASWARVQGVTKSRTQSSTHRENLTAPIG